MRRSGKIPNSGNNLQMNIIAIDQLNPIQLPQVKVGGEISRRINNTILENLLRLKIDNDFIAPFRRKESCDYIGLGKLIDAVVNFAIGTGDAEITALRAKTVSETIKTQEPDGYIGTMKPVDRMQKDYDIHEMGYLVFGLSGNYLQFRDEESVSAAVKLANYIISNWVDSNKKITTLGVEEGFILLSKVTGNDIYLNFCADTKMGYPIGYSTLREWQPPVEGHVYRYLCRCLTQLDLYRIEPGDSLLKQTQRAFKFLTSCNGLVITGTCSHKERWHDDQNGSGNLGETCATAYLIRLLDSMIRLEGDLSYGDIMERSIYNSLFAAQSPDGHYLRYYTPFEGKRTYFNKDLIELPSYDTYCCPNNFRRIIAELPTKIYYKTNDALAINLYTPSTAKIEMSENISVTVRQETDYPNTGHIRIYLTPSESSTFTVRLRIPRWCSRGQITVNGKSISKPVIGGQSFELTRKWNSGDYIILEMPMPWRIIKGRKRQEGHVAVMRGPIVYTLSPEHNGALHGVNLSKITIDPLSIGVPVKDESVRPDGLKCSIQAWSDGSDLKQSPDLNLFLTEFPDPTGEAVYFMVPSMNNAIHDELIETD